MKKMILVGTGIMVCLVVGSLAMAQAPEGIPEEWEEYLIQKDECLTGLAVRVPGVDKANMIWATEGIAWVNGIEDRINLIYAWTPIYLPESVEVLERALEYGLRIVPEKRASPARALIPKEEIGFLRGENKALREIISNRFIGAPWDRVIAMFKKFPDMSELTQKELESFDITAVVGKFDQYLVEVERGRRYYFWMVIIFIAGFVIVLTLYLMASGAKFNLQRKIDEIQANKKNNRLIR